MPASVGHRVLLRRAIAALASDKPAAVSGNTTLEQDKPVPTTVPLNMAQELATIQAVFGAGADKVTHEAEVTKVASSASEKAAAGGLGKQLRPCELIYGSDGKQLKPLQLTFPQFMLANIKILETLLSSSPSEAQRYLGYLKFLAVKGTRFQTRAILAFDQDYPATKLRQKFSWGSNVEDLSAQYFDAAVALKPPTERRSSGSDEFCFRWNFSPGGCPNPQSCRYKHVCIHCSLSSHKGKACTGAPTRANPNNNKKWTFRSDCAPLAASFDASIFTPPEEYPLNFHAWQKELSFDCVKDFILDGLQNGFKLIKESDVSGIAGYDGVNYTRAACDEFKPELDELFVLKIHGCATHRCVTKKEIHIVTRTVTVINNQTD